MTSIIFDDLEPVIGQLKPGDFESTESAMLEIKQQEINLYTQQIALENSENNLRLN